MPGRRRAPATLRDVFLIGARGGFAIAPECHRQPFGLDNNRAWYVRPESPVIPLAQAGDLQCQVVLWRDSDRSGLLRTFTWYRGERAHAQLPVLKDKVMSVEPHFDWFLISTRLATIQEALDRVKACATYSTHSVIRR